MTIGDMFPPGMQRALAALYAGQLSDAERREHDQRVADEMARAERRRAETPQLELGES